MDLTAGCYKLTFRLVTSHTYVHIQTLKHLGALWPSVFSRRVLSHADFGGRGLNQIQERLLVVKATILVRSRLQLNNKPVWMFMHFFLP